MNQFGNIVQRAFYLGVGLADYASEQANVKIQELRSQGQKLADEMVARGEMTSEEARKFVDELVNDAQKGTVKPPQDAQKDREPRHIEILSDEEEQTQETSNEVDTLRQQVESLQEELRQLRRK
ncbi:MAG: hypothetical protein BRC48_05175 [Cyanobacteria bacterium QS_9_48_30]|nr:MAG: hypothetical protein BRC48_05175 [Cyanobacteria bacterium QS_9_48_30]